MAKKKNSINISNSSLEDMIWMSYRYCIGRHTIAAAHHAETIHSVIKSNPDLMSNEKKAFTAKDIRREITSQIAFRSNVYVEGCNDFDAFSLLLIEGSKYKDRKDIEFTLNSYTNELTIKEKSDSKHEAFDKDYIDLMPWVRLANYLDTSTHRKIHTNFNGDIQVYTCYPYPVKQENGDYEMRWGELSDNLMMTRYLDEKFITKIEEI